MFPHLQRSDILAHLKQSGSLQQTVENILGGSMIPTCGVNPVTVSENSALSFYPNFQGAPSQIALVNIAHAVSPQTPGSENVVKTTTDTPVVVSGSNSCSVGVCIEKPNDVEPNLSDSTTLPPGRDVLLSARRYYILMWQICAVSIFMYDGLYMYIPPFHGYALCYFSTERTLNGLDKRFLV